ncbi:hypothetical protein D3C80_1770790 [compost metagenome]
MTSARRMPLMMRIRLLAQNALKRLLNSTMRKPGSNNTKASEMLSIASTRCWCAVSARKRASLSKWLLALSSTRVWLSASVRSRTCSASTTECWNAA